MFVLIMLPEEEEGGEPFVHFDYREGKKKKKGMKYSVSSRNGASKEEKEEGGKRREGAPR